MAKPHKYNPYPLGTPTAGRCTECGLYERDCGVPVEERLERIRQIGAENFMTAQTLSKQEQEKGVVTHFPTPPTQEYTTVIWVRGHGNPYFDGDALPIPPGRYKAKLIREEDND